MRIMDPIWTLLPYDLVAKICNMLPKVRCLPNDMKQEIQMQEMKLMNFYRSSRLLFGANTWVFVFNSLALYVQSKGIFELEPEWSPRDECFYIWFNLTPEERDEFLEFNYD